MSVLIRLLAILPALLLAGPAVQWTVNPASAAEGLGMPLLEGLGRSSQIGDMGALFVAGVCFCVLGAWKQQATWLSAAATLLGAAALMRTLAALLHGAPFATLFIGVEVGSAALLTACAVYFARQPGTPTHRQS